MSTYKIFVSYRRADSAFFASRISDYLDESFPGQVSKDIPLGANFASKIKATIEQCEVVLAIIGPSWLQVTDGRGRHRIGNPGDHVRQEIVTALQRQVPVIPLL